MLRRGQRWPHFARRSCPHARRNHRAVARGVFENSIDRPRVLALRSSRAHAAIETWHIPVNNTMTILRNNGAFLMVGLRIHAANCIATRQSPPRWTKKSGPETRRGRVRGLFGLRNSRVGKKAAIGGSPGVGRQTGTLPASHGEARSFPQPSRASRAGPCPRWKRWGRRARSP